MRRERPSERTLTQKESPLAKLPSRCQPSFARVAFDREPDHDGAPEADLAEPTALADELVERTDESWHRGGLAERLGVLAAEPDDRLRPRLRVVR